MSPHSRQSSCRLTPRRRLALGGIVLTSTLMAGLFVSTPAMALDAQGRIQDKSELTHAFQQGQSSIVLAESLVDVPEDQFGQVPADPDGVQTVPAGTAITLDLNGYSLDLDRIVVGQGSTLTVIDSSQSTAFDDDDQDEGNRLHVDAGRLTSGSRTAVTLGTNSTLHVDRASVQANGGTEGAGIGSTAGSATQGSHLRIDGSASVYATGGTGGAGVGGGKGASGIETTVSGGSLSAYGGTGGAGIGSGAGGAGAGSLTTTEPSSSVNYGYTYVSATGGDGAAGIGGGRGGDGAVVTLDSPGSTYARQGDSDESDGSSTASAIGAGIGGTAFGSLEIGESARLRLYSGTTTHLPAAADVKNAGSISLGGTIDGSGTIENTGSIDIDRTYGDDDSLIPDTTTHIVDSVKVTGHNYLVALDPNGGTAGTDSEVHLWGTDFSSYWYAKPTANRPGYTFFSWNSKADGSGRDADYQDLSDLTGASSSDGQPVRTTVFAQYGRPAALSAAALPDAGLGQPYDQPIPVTGDGLDYYSVGDYDDQDKQVNLLPAGLSINSSTGRISGVPSEAGSYKVRVYAGGDHTYVGGYLTIEVAGAPVIATSALPDAIVGMPYSASLQATGKGAIGYSIASGTLPAGLSLNAANGAISGTPTAAGPRAVVAKVTSSFGSSLQPLVLNVAAAAAAPSAPAPAKAAAPAAPVFAPVARTTVRFGHRLDLAVTASSTLPVTYGVTSGALPKGMSLDAQTGVISGVAAQEGTFTVTVTATSAAGTASTPVTITVPDIVELIRAGATPDVKVGAGAVPLKVAGLKKGERWTVRVDGKVVKHGTMKKAGALSTTVRLKKATTDTVHTIRIAGSRAVADPAQQAATTVRITSLATQKKLKVSAEVDPGGVKRVVVDKLAAGERVVVKEKTKVVAKGHADEDGHFTFPQSKAGKGTSTLTVHGATAKRAGRLTVKNHKH